MREAGSIARWTVVLLAATAPFLPEARAAGASRAIAIPPFDASTLEREYQWIGEAAAEAQSLEPIAVPEGGMLLRLLAPRPGMYARTVKVPLTDAETARMEKAARPTRSLTALELSLLARAIEADPTFAVAQYALGRVHQAPGNRWKANARFRAAIQLDASYPGPCKALGDLFLTATRPAYDMGLGEVYEGPGVREDRSP
jgi:hypothetical protein